MNKLVDEWLEIDRVVLYGWGNVGKKCFQKFEEDFVIVSIIDNDSHKWGYFRGVPILSAKEGAEYIKANKIIVLTGGKVYKNIADSLKQEGLKEYIDFCSVEIFISEWYWEKQGKNCLLEVHTAITMRCTFNCNNCNMFVPYYKEKIDYSVDEIKNMYDLFFQYVDYVFCITLLGGEPFLAPNLGEIIEYLGEKYTSKIGVINIISNGSIVPDEKTIEILSKNHVLVYISDYSVSIPYQEKLTLVIKKLRDNHIECVVRSSDEWKNFLFPVASFDAGQNIRAHMEACAPLFHGLNDNKFYYCHVAWSAEKARLVQLKKDDYVDLNKVSTKDKRILTQHALGNMEKKFVSLCQLCGGCGEDNPHNVKAAIQKG